MPVLQDDDTTITLEDMGDRTQRSVLQVNVAQPSDDAVYTCVAWNDAGSDEASAQLTVLGSYVLRNLPALSMGCYKWALPQLWLVPTVLYH